MRLVSAVVCTRNRSAMLVRAVKSLLEQTAPRKSFEIVVVDNGSTDDTQAQVQRLAAEFPDAGIRYEREERTGIAFARNTGFERANGEYVAYIDDDAVAERDWVSRIEAAVSSAKVPLVALGGRIVPLYESPKPAWFLDAYEERTWGAEPRYLARGESFSASNMVIRQQSLADVGGFATDVGMAGDRLMVGEEPLLFESLWSAIECSERIYYEPALCVRHSVPAAKMRLTAMAARKFVVGQFVGRVARSRPGRSAAVLRASAAVPYKLLVALLHLVRTKNVQRWMFEGLGIVAEPTGRLLALLGIEPRLRRD